MINLSELRNEMTKAALELLEFWMKNDLDEENGGFYNVSCWNEVMPDLSLIHISEPTRRS